MRITPPIASALLPISLPIFLPNRKPIAVITKATIPMVKLAVMILISRKAKLKPTTRASILVATDRVRSIIPFVISVFWLRVSPVRNDSQIILPPTIASRMKAAQWS